MRPWPTRFGPSKLTPHDDRCGQRRKRRRRGGLSGSVLWRGVDLWHVPTTLVAMVDSAHGGKTAVNLGRAKNQLGTFYPAHRVYICEDLLATLPIAQRRQGFVELIKGLWLGEPQIVLALEPSQVERIVSAPFAEIRDLLFPLLDAAIGVKHDIVARDPHEKRGIRTFLNFGHTMAHALELYCALDHGSAVAWGNGDGGPCPVKHGQMSQDEAHRLYQHDLSSLCVIHPMELPSDDQIVEGAHAG
ncbi:MAG: hypothetical protein R3E66_13075 [bacterium]